MNATFTGKEQAIAIKNIKREEHNRKKSGVFSFGLERKYYLCLLLKSKRYASSNQKAKVRNLCLLRKRLRMQGIECGLCRVSVSYNRHGGADDVIKVK